MSPGVRLLVVALGGLTVGAVLSASLTNRPPPSTDRTPDTLRSSRQAVAPAPLPSAPTPEALSTLPPDLASALAVSTPFGRDLALHRLASQSDAGFLREGIERMAGTGQSAGGRGAAAGIFLQRLTELSPEQALAQINRAATVDADYFTRIVFGTWAEVDLEAAIEGVRELQSTPLRQGAGDTIVGTWADLDPSRVDWIISRLPATYQAKSARRRLLARDVANDPAGTLSKALASTDPVARWKQVATIARLWADTDPYAALAQGSLIEDANARLAFERAVIDRWAQRDPRAAIAQISQRRRSSERGQQLMKILRHLTPVDPRAALQWAQELESVQGHTGYTQSVLRELAEHDAQLAADQLSRLSSTGSRQQVVANIAIALARQQPKGVLSWIDSLPSASERTMAFGAAVNALALGDTSAAIAMLESAPSERMRNEALASTVNRLADQRPEDAAQLLALLPEGSREYTGALQNLATLWARSDPYAALAWAERLPEAQRAQALPQTIGMLAQEDLLAAANLVQTLDGPERRQALNEVATRYGAKQPAAALSWVQRFAGEPGYEESLSGVLNNWVQQDPRGALLALDRIEPARATRLAPQLMSQWARAEPTEAARWVARLDDEAQAKSARAVAGVWAQTDARQAIAWAGDLSRGAGRDEAISSALQTGINQQPDFLDEAIDWLDEIQDPGQRENTATNIISRLARRDPSAARAQLERMSLSPARRTQLTSQIEAYERKRGG
ncbi:MAG: hypothetical protein AAF184_09370 [Pseudomonadota bacterium]